MNERHVCSALKYFAVDHTKVPEIHFFARDDRKQQFVYPVQHPEPEVFTSSAPFHFNNIVACFTDQKWYCLRVVLAIGIHYDRVIGFQVVGINKPLPYSSLMALVVNKADDVQFDISSSTCMFFGQLQRIIGGAIIYYYDNKLLLQAC